MNTTGVRARPSDRVDTHQSIARTISLGAGIVLAVDGMMMAGLAAVTPVGLERHLLELLLSTGILVPGVLLARAGAVRHRGLSVRVLLGEIVLAAALLSLGVAMPAVHAGGVTYAAGVTQFLGVLVALFLGATALALSAATRPTPPRFGRISPPAALRDGVILITGTILLAIALTQVALPALRPPRWNWVSFLGITVPGMLLLIAREAVRQVIRGTATGPRRTACRVASELLLVCGLTVMLYGSGANLILGRNGYSTGIRGNAAGLVVWGLAAAFLTLGRRVLTATTVAALRPGVRILLDRLMFVVAAAALILGERSMMMGRDPVVVFGGALPAASPILLGAALVLVAGRTGALTSPGS
ncbi:MAG: hypothetical protein QOG45_898 [Chloroflexota bacterium]|nr:hypothetical protein [Chloroflexota bacterium]